MSSSGNPEVSRGDLPAEPLSTFRLRSSLPRKLAIAGVIFGGVLLVVLAMLPRIIGSRWVYQPLLERLEAGDFRLQVDSVELYWFSPVELRNVVVRERTGSSLLAISKIRSDRGLLGYLLGGRRIGRVELVNPTVDIELVTNESNLGRLIEAVEGKVGKEAAGRPKSRPALDVDVAVRGMNATVKRPGLAEPLVIIPAFDADLSYQAATGDSRLVLKQTQLLDHVQLTPELIKLGLGYALPLLAESAWFEGRVSLSTGAIEVPLDQPWNSTGDAVVTLHQVRSGPSQPVIVNLLDLIAKLRNREPQHELVFVDGSQVNVRIGEQRVHHQGLRFGLPRVDQRLQVSTSGAVGLSDRALDLTIALPIPVEQLARRDSVKDLGVPMVHLPLVGTLDDPKIQWSALRDDSADLVGMMRERVQAESPATAAILGGLEGLAEGKADEAIAAAADIVRELRAKRQAKLKEQAAAEEAQGKTTSEKKEPEKPRPIRDAIRDLLRNK